MPVEAPAPLACDVSDDWLQPLGALLAPLRPERLAVVGGLELPLKVQWIERLPPDALIIEPRNDALIGRSGWLFQLPGGAEPHLLFVATADESAVGDAQLDAATALVRWAWQVRCGADESDQAHAAAVGEAVHALRNSLNSVLMSAAVITTCADLLPERLQPIAREIEAAASRSVQRLHRLTGLIESRP